MTHCLDLIEDLNSLREEYIASVVQHYGNNTEHESQFRLKRSAGATAIKSQEAINIAEILLYLKPKRILEIGSYLGFSARWILEVTQSWGAELTSIDPNMKHRGFDNPRGHFKKLCAPHQNRITAIDAFVSFGIDGVDNIPVIKEPIGEFDFAFIDGNHQFPYVLRDNELVASMLPKGGIIVGDDAFSHAQVIAATECFAQTSPLLDFYCIYNIKKIPLGSVYPSLRAWNRRRVKKRRFLQRKGHVDGLTMTNIPSSYNPPKEKKLVGTPAEFIARSDEFLKKRLLKTTIKKQLRKWGYKQK